MNRILKAADLAVGGGGKPRHYKENAPFRKSRLWAVLLSLLLSTLAVAQPDSEIEGYRAPGTRTRTAAEERRYYTGPDELQPEITRPADFARLSEAEAGERLAALRTLVPERSVSSLLPGLEEFRAVNERLRRTAKAHPDAVRMTRIGAVHGLEVNAIELLGKPNADGSPRPRLLIIGGVHSGTEKTGFESATRFVESAAKDATLRAKFDITVVPLVSPAALVLGTRENASKIDINRTFAEGKWTPESKIFGDFVKSRPAFDMSVDLHTAGDPGRDGFFVIRGDKDGGLATRIMRALPSAALLDLPGAAPGEAKVGPYALYGVGTSEIPSIEATTMDLLKKQGAKYVYTFEAPTRANPDVQVRMTLRFLDSALNNARTYGRFGPRAPPSLDAYRRADKTLDWKRVTRERALSEVGGLAHFGLALFLKEVAVVASTGDRARIEEFFDSLLTTDFYKHYGLFVAGARVGEVAYTRYLQRYIRPQFVNGMLKTNLVLAAGIALPAIVDGSFEGRAFAITVGSLGLSTAAVRAGVRGIKWVHDLKGISKPSTVARLGAGASRLAKVGGWFYTAAELAVVLYVAEAIETRVNAHLDLEAARDELAEAGAKLIEEVNASNASDEVVEDAAEDYRAAWTEYRNFLYRPLHIDEGILASRLERLARRAKLRDDERRAALDRVGRFPALERNVTRRHGSVAGYADHLTRSDEAALQDELGATLESYAKNREAHLDAVYRSNRRGAPLFADLEHLDWLLQGSSKNAANDPARGRSDPYARLTRWRSQASLSNALSNASENRLEAYSDEREILAALAAALRKQGHPSTAGILEASSARVALVEAADQQLIDGDTGVLHATGGATERVDALVR